MSQEAKLTTPRAILLAGAIIALALYFGLNRSAPQKESGAENQPEKAVAPERPAGPRQAKVSIDDDPILGDRKKAKVAIVEFSDFECPFCKRFRQETLDQIKENFIDSGEVILVYRDLPLSFHNPAAEREAMAAECVQDLAGDEKYFVYHDRIFETTPGNGKGLSESQLITMATELGIDRDKFSRCLKEEKFKKEVAQDAQDAAKVGIQGTPGFVIGRLKGDQVEGVIVSGAQPYSVFETTIKEQLNR